MLAHEVLSEELERLSLYPVFGNPGTTELPMLQSVSSYILTLHDSIALGMADGYAQSRRKPSVCSLHTVPGLGNSMAFLHTASMNRSPVVVTAGQQDYRHMFYEPILSGPTETMASPFVKYHYEIRDPNDISRSLRRAYQIALAPPSGPVFLSFPMNIMDKESGEVTGKFGTELENTYDDKATMEIMQMLNSAENPALILGYEIDAFSAMDVAVEFAHRLGLKVFSEPLASRSPYPSEDQQFAGDLPPASALINMMLADCDFVLIVGGNLTLYPFTPAPLLPGKTVVSVGFESPQRADFTVRMHPGEFLKNALKYGKKNWNYRRPKDYSLLSEVARARKRLDPLYFIHGIRESLKGYSVVDEAISASPVLRRVLGYGSDRYFTAKSGQLGWGLAAGAGIALSGKKTLSVVGDGSFLYTVQALWTLKRYGIPLKVLVLDNGGYSILRSFASSYYPNMRDLDYLRPEIDVVAIARSFGIETDECDPDLKALSWLSEGDGPKVLVAHTNSDVPKLFL